MTLEKLTLLLGQRLAVGFDGYTVPQDYIDLVKKYKIGNVVLFRRNVRDYAQLKALCASLHDLIKRETGFAPFISLDEEGGSVSRLAHVGIPTPSAMGIGSTGDDTNAYAVGRIIGKMLRSVGLNMDLAPDLDVNTNPKNPVIGVRSFGSTPELVSRMGVAFTRGLQSTGVYACGKHFPGHGDTDSDSHLGLPVVDKPMDRLTQVELAPFAAAAQAGIEAIMSAHVVFPALDPGLPCTVSRRVMTDLLRGQLGFEGLIISDGMEMQGVMDLYGIEEATLRALTAGIDIALICHSAGQAADTMAHMLKGYADGRFNDDELQREYDRIIAAKLRQGELSGDAQDFSNPDDCALCRDIMRRIVRPFNRADPLPLITAETVMCGSGASPASQANDAIALSAPSVCARALGCRYESQANAVDSNTADTAVVFISARTDERPTYVALANRLIAAGKSVVVISMGADYLLAEVDDRAWKIAVYQYDNLGVQAVIDLLKGC